MTSSSRLPCSGAYSRDLGIPLQWNWRRSLDEDLTSVREVAPHPPQYMPEHIDLPHGVSTQHRARLPRRPCSQQQRQLDTVRSPEWRSDRAPIKPIGPCSGAGDAQLSSELVYRGGKYLCSCRGDMRSGGR